MSIHICNLPVIHFWDERGQLTKLELKESGKHIRAFSEEIELVYPKGSIIGLLFPTSPELILMWLAILDSKCVPVIMQYPTQRQNDEYWRSSVANIIGSIGLTGVICSREMNCEWLIKKNMRVMVAGEIKQANSCCELIEEGTIVQMSSGTTGYRKAISYSLLELELHAQRFNDTLGLSADDCVVSWLPLYHDMGFIACFVMPLFTGTPMVLVDPMRWVENKLILFQMIECHQGTICYMPNFGFEVMSRLSTPYKISSIKKWISCSEPTRVTTIQKFCSNFEIPIENVSTCYAMAENVFAVTISEKIEWFKKSEKQVASCGKPIAGTQIKIIDNEIFVKSDTSIRHYVDGSDIVDAEGFFPTGDVGFWHNGELFVEGRIHDVMVQAGRKYILSDLDNLINENIEGIDGRVACIAFDDEMLGTQKLKVIIETNKFFYASEQKRISRILSEILPLEVFELNLMPMEFITKTSSGKVNRKKTFEDWQTAHHWQDKSPLTVEVKVFDKSNLSSELHRLFPYADFTRPIMHAVDSLGLIIVETIASEYGVPFLKEMTFADLLKDFHIRRRMGEEVPQDNSDEIVLISLMEYRLTGKITSEEIQDISSAVGLPVRLEHVCLPPSFFLLQDLIFCDYFLCRDWNEDYKPYYETIQKLREASIILTDDNREEYIHRLCSFPVMNKKLRRAPIADLLGMRWQKYGHNHHKLPVGELFHGQEVTPEEKRQARVDIEEYLKIPFFRVALHKEYELLTRDWHYQDLEGTDRFDHEKFVETLKRYLVENSNSIKTQKRVTERSLVEYGSDPPHFCSFCINPLTIEYIVKKFERFLILGMANSIPYLMARLRQEKKSSETILCLDGNRKLGVLSETDFDCVLVVGSTILPEVSIPIVSIIAPTGDTPDIINCPPDYFMPCKPPLLPPQLVRLLREISPVDFMERIKEFVPVPEDKIVLRVKKVMGEVNYLSAIFQLREIMRDFFGQLEVMNFWARHNNTQRDLVFHIEKSVLALMFSDGGSLSDSLKIIDKHRAVQEIDIMMQSIIRRRVSLLEVIAGHSFSVEMNFDRSFELSAMLLRLEPSNLLAHSIMIGVYWKKKEIDQAIQMTRDYSKFYFQSNNKKNRSFNTTRFHHIVIIFLQDLLKKGLKEKHSGRRDEIHGLLRTFELCGRSS